MVKNVLLFYLDFNKEFKIRTDARNIQSVAVISQNGIPIAFYSGNLTDSHTRYTVTEKELLIYM